MNKYSEKTIYQVDAFTNEIFKGNPAAVMIVDTIPPDSYMQNIAMEMNLSETAFVCPQDNSFLIRYFTPTTELPIAGHPTLAAAHILYELGLVSQSDQITFKTPVTEISVTRNNELITMQLPIYPIKIISNIPKLKNLIGFEPIEVYESKYNWIIALAPNEEDIINSSPDINGLLKNNLGHLMMTAKSNSPKQDFVVRCFAPALGVNEDPVTGSAHCALTPLWANKLRKTDMTSLQLSKRTGRLSVKLLKEKVEISGQAITVFEAKLK